MPHSSRRWRRAAAPVALLAVVGAGLSCRDALAPEPQPPVEIRADVVPPPFTATVGVTSSTNPQITQAINSFPENVYVSVEFSGNLTATHKDGSEAPRVFGPNGYNCQSYLDVFYQGTAQYTRVPGGAECTTGGATQTVRIPKLWAGGQGYVRRSSGSWRCSYWPYDVCWTFSGTQQVTITVINYSGTLRAWQGAPVNNFRTTVPAGTSLWFNWWPDSTVDLKPDANVSKKTYNWWFETSRGTTIANPIPVGANNQSWNVPESGTMYVKVKINSVEKTLSQYIHVGAPTLKLGATPTKVYVGDTVHFKADIKPESTSVSDLRWYWFRPPEVISALRANVVQAPNGQPAATALPANWDSSEVKVCGGYRTCDFVVPGEGFMRVFATLAGVPNMAESGLDLRHVKIQLSATPKRVIKGKRVYFRATASTSGGTPAPVGITQWTWQDATGVSTPSCATGYSDCDMFVYRSGSMRAIGTVNGSTDTAFVSVSAFDCDTIGVAELDDLDTRDELDAWFERRRVMPPNYPNYTGPERNGREGFYLVGPDGTGGITRVELPTPDATCYRTGAADHSFTTVERTWLLIHPHVFIPDGRPVPVDCREGCIWLRNPVTGEAGWTCTEFAASEFPGPASDPSGKDIENDPGYPVRNAIITPDSVISWRNDPSGQGAPTDVRRKSRASWKACTQNPI